LPDDERKLVVEFFCEYFIAHLPDEVAFFYREHTQFLVGLCCGFLQICESVNDLFGHAGFRTDPEVVTRAFRLCAPVFVGGYLHFAHGVFFDSETHRCKL
jgi:hypothetical protein